MVALHDPLDEVLREELREYDDLTAGLLFRRGITTRQAAHAFLSPSYDEHLGDPMRILNMPRAAERIAQAISNKEKITVWSDYDCDGIPGGVLLHDFLKKAGAHFTNYIPHRHHEGYGVNVLGIEKLAREGTRVMVTVDSGITDTEALTRARELGIDVILTDHHVPERALPPAFAIIDPKQDGETYPFRDFCGAGLAWKLVCGVLAHGFKGREDIPLGWEKWLLDMAGLATIADMVPLVGENRVIAKYGLLVMRKSPRVGLQKLCQSARVDQRFLTEDDVGFTIAPRVNAASRMGTPRDAFELFTTESEARAEELAKELEKANRSRRAAAASITRAVHECLEKRKSQGNIPEIIVFGDPDWRPSLLGLVANTVAQEYERPVFLWGREGGAGLKGSCRAGIPLVSVVEIMQGAPELFIGFGGHRASGGFTVKDREVFNLEERLCQAFRKLSLPKGNTFTARADAVLTLPEATHTVLEHIARLAPFGVENEKPVFAFRNVSLQSVTWFGKSEEHLKLSLTSDGFDTIDAISFYAKRELGPRIKTLSQGTQMNVLASLERDQFTRGRPVRLRLVAIS